MQILFWICLGLITYTYLVYPFLIIILARIFPTKSLAHQNAYPPVAMVVSAFNEEKILDLKIKNCLSIDYPPDRIRFVFGSDGSDDDTNQILSSQKNPRFFPILFSEREGKSIVLNKLIKDIEEEIILFSDANSIYQPDAVKLLMRHFSDPGVGGVCGKLTLINPDGSPGGEGEGLYWRFENMIKKAEGTLNSVISANGAILAVRNNLLDPLPTHIILNDDFEITLQILTKLSRVLYEPEAVAEEHASPNMRGEFIRKIRISSLNFNALPGMLPLLHPKYGFTALAIFSHKLLRWMVPLLGFGMLISNLLLLTQGGIYPFLLVGQGLVYLCALMGFLGDHFFDTAGPFLPFYYLAMINIAIVIGLWRSLTGTQKQAWERIPH